MTAQEAEPAKPVIHPNWELAPESITDGYSLEVTSKDILELLKAAPLMWKGMPIAVPFLPGEKNAVRIEAAKTVRELGFEPMPHFSARRISSHEEFHTYLKYAVEEAGVRRCFVVAGDPANPVGPFADSSALLVTGAFEQAGIKVIGIGGHPDGHPVMSPEECWEVLANKCDDIYRRGMAPLIVTQFAFDADAVLNWLVELRARGLDVPVRIGIPGPAGIKALLRFSALCGVSASAAVMAKYGISLGRLLGTAGPDKLVDRLVAGLGPQHGAVRLHFYPFGGLAKTIEWVKNYRANR